MHRVHPYKQVLRQGNCRNDYTNNSEMAVSRVHQRQIVEIAYRFHDGTVLPHPALIVSPDNLQDIEEGMFYAVLISSKNIHPEFTIEIDQEDLIGSTKLPKQSYFVTHIISYFTYFDVISNFNLFVKKERFDLVVDKVIDSIFGPI